jgi:hypothetical protein
MCTDSTNGLTFQSTTNRNLDKMINSFGIKLSKQKQDSFREFIKNKIQTHEPNFNLENVELKKWEFMFEDWKKSTNQKTLESKLERETGT